MRADFHRLTGTATTAASHLHKTRVAIAERAVRLEERLGDGIDITNGTPSLTPLRSDRDPRTESIRSAIGGLLPRVDLADVLIEVDNWCGYTDQFTHATGATPRSVVHRRLLYAAVLAQACNLGISAMGEISDVTSRQLAWTTDWYLRDDTLRSAVAQIVKHHHRLPGASVWGSGIMSSSDGQRFPVPVSSINATALPRYFNRGRGVEMYTWTSDQYSQYGSKIVPATVRDATHVLDELLDNEADLPIVEHTTDTAGYTDLIFGLFDLLGLTFSPRLRNIANQRLYRLEPIPEAPTVSRLLRHRINTELVTRHWDDMIRTAPSLKSGDVTASLLVSRLQAGARRNHLTRAIQELGRAAKTRFLLAYLEDQSYRRRIQRQLNKGDTLHALRRFIFFANEAQIRHRRPEDETNQALCLNLVINAVICWNTVYIAAAIDLLRHNGTISSDDDLSRISPALRDHINPYGRYTFDLEQPTSTLRSLHQTEHTYDP